ncbi:MAG: hypothetical protein JXR94_17695 [Candidatus Hydrogenedentes bacterium]|nr:hypothetical protein [Candidatus Hydrogenedentota bacterium]
MPRAIRSVTALALLTGTVGAAFADWDEALPGAGSYVSVHRDFTADFDASFVANALDASFSLRQQCGNVCLPGIFLHPKNAEDAVLTYEGVVVPAGPSLRSFVIFRIGIRDGVPWDEADGRANGVRFIIAIDGEVVFSDDAVGVGWHARAVDVSPWAGRAVRLEFRTNAIDGHTGYDWAVFGEPALVSLPDDAVLGGAELRGGIALAGVACPEPSVVTVAMGAGTGDAVSETLRVGPGTHWVPLHFAVSGPVTLEVGSGAATLVRTLARAYPPQLTSPEVALSSPLVTAGRPFSVTLTTKNEGRGAFPGAYRVEADCGAPLELGPLAPGASATLRWDGLCVDEPGDWAYRVGPVSASCHVFPREPVTPAGRGTGAYADVPRRGPIAASVGNAWARLSFVTDESRDAYAIAEAWNGRAWQRVGSLYPLVKVVARAGDAPARALGVRIHAFEARHGGLTVSADVFDAGGRAWPVRIAYGAEAAAPRIAIEAELGADCPTDLLAFYAPTVLAGDRAFGVEKDFAIFPGLEYLEGDEPSSSERDLAYPLSDRRVPAIHKIATPLLAVQGEDALVALLWDANQEWAEGEKHPAARFHAPAFDSGLGFVHLALFAPSVGEYVEENHYEATHPYRMKTGESLRLKAWLVLDHKARYGQDSIVQGPHNGGLVLQAMQHWFETYGLPGPSPQPRPWDEERALCRHAYAGPVWGDDPPGWRHTVDRPSQLLVGHAVPQLIDLRAGVSPEVQAGVEHRIALVLNRAIQEQGPHYLWAHGGCHIMMGELPFYYGYLPEALQDFRQVAFAQIAGREDGLWVWRSHSEKHAVLGVEGHHTLGQPAHPSMMCLRAARLTGDRELAAQALDAMRQMERYEVPRGAQMWECPLYQPDILAAGRAIRAYCEAYRLTGDPAHLAQARYWAWTGLPFLYFWEMEGYPTMKYNVISVIGSTFYSHSWLGLPVVWCGLVYGYGLLDLAEFDDSFPWAHVAQGIVNSTMWQQYTDGPSKGCYPDSWSMVENKPHPADISPENILVNEFRLRGLSPEIRFARFDAPDGPVMLNSAADIVATAGSPGEGAIEFGLQSVPGFGVYTLLAPVPEPARVDGAGPRVDGSEALCAVPEGWFYDGELEAVILKHTPGDGPVSCKVGW